VRLDEPAIWLKASAGRLTEQAVWLAEPTMRLAVSAIPVNESTVWLEASAVRVEKTDVRKLAEPIPGNVSAVKMEFPALLRGCAVARLRGFYH